VLNDREAMYRLPFEVSAQRNRALVVGAGTGNDVAAALRAGFKQVVAVEIDPVIHDIGMEHHPEKPYGDPRVEVIVSDARTFFERYSGEKFDVVCFGLLDSHAMFSAMSSLRLDNYVYTDEAIRAAWRLVADGGVLTVSFSVAGGHWIAERMTKVLKHATGVDPLILNFRRQFVAWTWIVGKNIDPAERVAASPHFLRENPPPTNARMTTDDWPFLYLRPRTFPWGFVTILIGLLAIGAIGARFAYGESFLSWQRFSGPFFFLGAAFLLIETRGVTNLSLLFGSTWIVNSAVFAGILLAALLANILVKRFQFKRLTPLFVALFFGLLLNFAIHPGDFLRFSPGVGGVLAALLNGIPVGIAGMIFSLLLSRSSDPAASLGWNLLGAVFGGCLEYLSMALGLRALVLIALVLYALAYLATEGTRLLHRRTASVQNA
jgi:ubiquinone/menaquinone biosynthesis C-methylase UbiE